LDKEKNLIPVLFDLNCFEEINNLISSKKAYHPNFTEEHFKKAIYEFQHEIIIFFMKKDQFTRILDGIKIQKFIVKEYFR